MQNNRCRIESILYEHVSPFFSEYDLEGVPATYVAAMRRFELSPVQIARTVFAPQMEKMLIVATEEAEQASVSQLAEIFPIAEHSAKKLSVNNSYSRLMRNYISQLSSSEPIFIPKWEYEIILGLSDVKLDVDKADLKKQFNRFRDLADDFVPKASSPVWNVGQRAYTLKMFDHAAESIAGMLLCGEVLSFEGTTLIDSNLKTYEDRLKLHFRTAKAFDNLAVKKRRLARKGL